MGGICLRTVQEIGELARSAIMPAPEDYDASEFTSHLFAHNTYARTITLPANYVAIGKIHRHSCINFIMSGSMVLIMTDGTRRVVTGPCMFVSEPGVQKAGYTLTPLVMTTVHATNGTQDIEEIEKAVTVESLDQWLLEQEQLKQLENGEE